MRSILTALLWLLAAPFLLVALLHLVTSDGHMALAALHGGIGWWLVPAGPLGALALLLGRRTLACSCLAVALAHAAWVLPGHLRLWPPRADGEALSVGTANLFAVNPTPEQLAQELLALDPDLWCLQELTPSWGERLDSGEVAARWPYRQLRPEDSGYGMGLLSKRPLQEAQFVDLAGVPMGLARVEGLTLACVHTDPPVSAARTARWREQLQSLRRWAATVPGPLVITGDLNATRHHPSWQALTRGASLRDALAEVGQASAWSWPAPPYGRFFPKWRIDHVLLSDELRARSARVGRSQGSDHRPIVVALQR